MARIRVLGLTMIFLLMCVGAALADDSCKACHEGTEDRFVKNTHARLNNPCTACHGAAEQHSADPSVLDMVNFKDPKQGEAITAACMSCHGKDIRLMFWDGSKHDSADVSCTSCHVIHTVGTERENMDTCLNCHKDVRRDIKKFSHHPLTEGKLKCSSCHNVHGSLGPSLMTKNTVNQLCYDCHTEKRGPFRFAHPPVEENCLTCHNAHGANSTALLTMNLRNTCQACHSYRHHANPLTENNTSRGTAFMARQSCLNCHGDIHGSNQDYHFR